jgi:hypothetical protein
VVCFRYIIVNTLHKGDNKDGGDDDDDDNNNNNKLAYVDLCPRASRPVRTDPHVFCVYESGWVVLGVCRWDRQVVPKLL